ncbi:SEC-C metal-binding domain-containing protein [Fictibacillus sp. 18YEL24]|uniref:SEC-C metal-binding domain-containing protein n=1 Tax=Fictibacillus sp. 18YEL24 TaxID=2745875 RepID=UPI0018CDFE8E|nr:SEC-C metal-binding domain-containing protein [Fictibacillus sp. 18YEL24]MBH0169306.1 SEC-C domain-containing protein [Fictibacillus sp. 18YEL24]
MVSKNQLCPCNSKKKYKLCCLSKNINNKRRISDPRISSLIKEVMEINNIDLNIINKFAFESHSICIGEKSYCLKRLEQLLYEINCDKKRIGLIQLICIELYLILVGDYK